jgi:hypothetical protein
MSDHDTIRRELDGMIDNIAEQYPGVDSDAVFGAIDQLDRWPGEHFAYHVRLVLDNEEGSYNRRRELVAEALDTEHSCPVCEGMDDEQGHICTHCEGSGIVRHPISDLMDSLKEWVEEMIYPDPSQVEAGGDMPMMARELLGSAISFVDWHDLATGYIEEEQEARAAA